MKNKATVGHLLSLFTVLVWGTTFISTKVLLSSFEPTEILVMRFAIGFIMLFFLNPKIIPFKNAKHEILFVLAGICGVSLYFLGENIALTMTYASNVSVIVSAAPFFTAISSRIFLRDSEKLHAGFFIGFIISMAGISVISFAGAQMKLNPVGDILAILAALVWAFYSVLVKKISALGYSTVQTTRRIFGYGLIFMLPAIFFLGFSPDFSKVVLPVNILNLLFLGVLASALCFVSWNLAVKYIGTMKTSVYIYLVPVITVIFSWIFLDEKLTVYSFIGTVLTLSGLIISEIKFGKKQK